MNKIEKIFFATCLSLTLIGSTHNIIAKDFEVQVAVFDDYINFDEETGKPFAENGRTLVPLRITMESLGVNVNWNSEKNCIELNKGFKQVVVPFNESYITVNNKRITTDALPVIINDRTYLPIRFVCEAFDYSVNWDQENKVVEIDDFSDLIPEGLDESNATIIDEPINVRTSKRITGKNIAYQVHKGDRVLVKSKIGTWYKILDGSNELYIYADDSFFNFDNINEIEVEEIVKLLPNGDDYIAAGYGPNSFRRNWVYGLDGASDHDEVIIEVANKYGVDPVLVKLIVANESNGNVNTVGAGTYYGLMQVGKGWFSKLNPVTTPDGVVHNITADEILSDAYVAIDAGIQVLIKHDKGNVHDTMVGYGGGASYLSYGFGETYEAISGRSEWDSIYAMQDIVAE